MNRAQALFTRAASLAVALLLVAGAPSHAAGAVATVTGVTLGEAPDEIRVIIMTTGPVRYQLRPVRPEWVVVDILGAELAPPPLPIPSGREGLRRIRVGQYEHDVVRVVIELAQPMRFVLTISGDPSAIVVTLSNDTQSEHAQPRVAAGQAESESQRVVPGKRIGLVRLGMSMQDVVAVLGLSTTTESLPDGSVDHHWLTPPGTSDLGVRATKGVASRIWIRSASGYAITERLHIGSTEDDVRGVLGAPSWVLTVESQAKMKMLIYDSTGVWLSIQLDERKPLYNTVFEIGIMPPEQRS